MDAGNQGGSLMSPVAVSLIAFIFVIAGASGVHAMEIRSAQRKSARR